METDKDIQTISSKLKSIFSARESSPAWKWCFDYAEDLGMICTILNINLNHSFGIFLQEQSQETLFILDFAINEIFIFLSLCYFKLQNALAH